MELGGALRKRNSTLQKLEITLEELISTSSGRRAFLKATPFLLAACASVPKTRYREGDNTGQTSALTVDEERRMTAELLPKMRKDYPALKNKQMQRYISDLGSRIVRRNGLGARPYNYNFSFVDVNFINAFALPAGTVFVTVPLLAATESEAELAGVIGHEIGHIKARHSAERMFTATKAKKKSWLYVLGGGLTGAALGYGLGRLICPPKDKACLAKTATYGGAAGVSGGLLIQKYAFMANSREDEMEADRIGFRASTRAGYHKNYVGRFYSKLLKMEADRKKNQSKIVEAFADAMSTHPPSRERVKQMKEMASVTKKKGRISSEYFEQMRKQARIFVQKKGIKI